MTSFGVILRHNQQKWYHFVEQAQGYLINVSLFPRAVTERKSREGVPFSFSPCTMPSGVILRVKLYLRGLIARHSNLCVDVELGSPLLLLIQIL